MKRADKYREEKKRIKHRFNYVLAVVLALCILIAGIAAVDYATVFLSTGERNINVFSVTSGQSGIDIKFMNIKLGHMF